MGNSRFVPFIISTSKPWQKSTCDDFCEMNFTASFGQHEAKPVLEDFESLGLLSRNCFDLLVKALGLEVPPTVLARADEVIE
jgi:hypothetical protein